MGKVSENRILKSFIVIRHTNETTVAVSDSIGNTPFKSNGISPMKTMPLRSTSAHQAFTKGQPYYTPQSEGNQEKGLSRDKP